VPFYTQVLLVPTPLLAIAGRAVNLGVNGDFARGNLALISGSAGISFPVTAPAEFSVGGSLALVGGTFSAINVTAPGEFNTNAAVALVAGNATSVTLANIGDNAGGAISLHSGYQILPEDHYVSPEPTSPFLGALKLVGGSMP
jgi:hypothetical protein